MLVSFVLVEADYVTGSWHWLVIKMDKFNGDQSSCLTRECLYNNWLRFFLVISFLVNVEFSEECGLSLRTHSTNITMVWCHFKKWTKNIKFHFGQ